MSSREQSLSMVVVQRTFSRMRRGYDPAEVERHLELVSLWFISTRVGQALSHERAELQDRERRLDERELVDAIAPHRQTTPARRSNVARRRQPDAIRDLARIDRHHQSIRRQLSEQQRVQNDHPQQGACFAKTARANLVPQRVYATASRAAGGHP